MPFFDKPELKRAAGRLGSTYKSISESRRELKGRPWDTSFDIFLSHCFSDLDYVLGLKNTIEKMGYSVYTDWDADSDLNRRAVTSDTASILRQRMKHSRCVFYAVSGNSSESKWMPWELGYGDGLHSKVAIVPVTDRGQDSEDYRGLEYLGLCPYVAYDGHIGKVTDDLYIHRSEDEYIYFPEWLQGKSI
jgi:hypothetical protein